MKELPDFISEYSELFGAIKKVVPPSMKIYLVGGAVRDIVLGRKINDFDFTVEGLVRPIGKHIANELNGAYYVLDDEREMVRVIISDNNGGQFGVDIALMAGDTIDEDLRDRDFTFNAMAIDLRDEPVLVDPLGGLEDLENKTLRMCSPESLRKDPLRAMSAVRMSLEFGLEMDEQLVEAMKAVPAHMGESSFERYRDELFKIVRLNQNDEAVRICERFGLLDHLFPNHKTGADGIDIEWIADTDLLMKLITTRVDAEDSVGDEFLTYAVNRLGNYRTSLNGFFERTLALYHNRRMLLSYSVIARTLTEDPDLIKKWSNRLAFSSMEINFAAGTAQAYDYLMSLGDRIDFSDVEIYRYFRQFKECGISGLMLYLSKKYEERNAPEAYRQWCDCVVFAQKLFAAFFSRFNEVIDPKPLLSGDDIQKLLGIPAGPEIGYAKNALIEAQIKGAVNTTSEAEAYLKQIMRSTGKELK